MKKITIFLSAIILLFTSCQNDIKQIEVIDNKKNIITINPYDDFEKIDSFLKELSEPSQFFTVPSTEITEVKGKYGTIIKVNPELLITEAELPINDSIKVELIEMINNQSLIFNNAQTISNGNILVTGGAYYINMTSGGEQLKIKEGGIEVEFSKLSDDEMELFIGKRDSLNQINWISLNKKLTKKNLTEPNRPKEYKKENSDTTNDIEIFEVDEFLYLEDTIPSKPKEVKKETSTKDEYEQYQTDLVEYNRKIELIKQKKKTYQAINILNFGWINCDRFYRSTEQKVNIELSVSDTTIQTAKFFAIFKDIKSIMNGYFSRVQNYNARFTNIPLDTKLKIIGIAFKKETPYWFEKDITAGKDVINVDFTKSTHKDIENKMRNIN